MTNQIDLKHILEAVSKGTVFNNILYIKPIYGSHYHLYHLQGSLASVGDTQCAISKMSKFKKVDGKPGTYGAYRNKCNIWVGICLRVSLASY